MGTVSSWSLKRMLIRINVTNFILKIDYMSINKLKHINICIYIYHITHISMHSYACFEYWMWLFIETVSIRVMTFYYRLIDKGIPEKTRFEKGKTIPITSHIFDDIEAILRLYKANTIMLSGNGQKLISSHNWQMYLLYRKWTRNHSPCIKLLM